MARHSLLQTVRWLVAVLLVAAVVVVWTTTPLPELLNVDRAARAAAPLRTHWWGAVVAAVGYGVGAMLFVPLTPMVAALVLVYGAYIGFLVALAGIVLGACMGHGVGRFVLRDALRRRLTRWAPAVSEAVSQHDLRAAVVMRLMPVPPFAIMNLVAGSMGLRLHYFALGTALGALPGLVLMVWVSDGVLSLLRNPSAEQLAQLAAAVGAAVVLSLALYWARRRWLIRRDR